jgi:hypothetical protein
MLRGGAESACGRHPGHGADGGDAEDRIRRVDLDGCSVRPARQLGLVAVGTARDWVVRDARAWRAGTGRGSGGGILAS